MKKIKLIMSFFVVIILIIGVSVFLKKEDYSYYLVMGDYISNNQVFNSQEVVSFSSIVGEYLKKENKVDEVNSKYLRNNMTSKKLLEMIENDVYMINDSSLVDLINKSKYITISLGINDIINQIKYDSKGDKLVYDKDIINNKIEIFKHNYYEILNEIKNINEDAKIILVGCYNLYGDEEINRWINSAIEEVCNEVEGYYVDVSDIKDRYLYLDNQLYLTSTGQEMISGKVIEVIEKIEG